jgi:hypothetical protein
MSKTHSKTNTIKNSLLIVVGFCVASIVMHLAIGIKSIVMAQKNPVIQGSPALVQQQTIQKAYDALTLQTR